MAKVKKKTTAELLQDSIAEAVDANEMGRLQTVDFADPLRQKTCIEVDFPILEVNSIVQSEGNNRKPVYRMAKWLARREATVFRAMLIAAATRAPADDSTVAQSVWNAYYHHHNSHSAFSGLAVADIFMGGGTTIVEGARLGMKMLGNDLNPMAWFVVKSELARTEVGELEEFLRRIEQITKPKVAAFYACNCPRGCVGKWFNKHTKSYEPSDFDPFSISVAERCNYEYEGPEVVYTFWARHGECQGQECNHRTPILTTSIMATKTISVRCWSKECTNCREQFDVEQREARMAPSAELVIDTGEEPYSILDSDGAYVCPHCGEQGQDFRALAEGKADSLGKHRNKKVKLTLLVSPRWSHGCDGLRENADAMGGRTEDSVDSTIEWLDKRERTAELIEYRGDLPEEFETSSGDKIQTDARGGNGVWKIKDGKLSQKNSSFYCQACGKAHNVLSAINETGTNAATAPYAIHGYCRSCDEAGELYGGRFFDVPNATAIGHSIREWDQRAESLSEFFPREALVPEGLETTVRTPLHKYGFTKWRQFFNSRQLLVHSQLLEAAVDAVPTDNPSLRLLAMCAFQQYLRNQNMFCIWNIQGDKLEPFLSKNNLHPPARPVENGAFIEHGRGNWQSCCEAVIDGMEWNRNPWEFVSKKNLESFAPELAKPLGTAKTTKIPSDDKHDGSPKLSCASSTDLSHIDSESVDLVITDPPFGDIMQYAELSGFMYCWLQPTLVKWFPRVFEPESPPTALEAVENAQRHGDDSSDFYKRLLTGCWREAHRILKSAGILAFTFHHDKDGPWVAVLESLFDAGFYLEAAYPIRSDETKGEGSKPGTFGAQKVEYDVIHVCRKRLNAPEPISWARLRRVVMRDVRQIQELLEQHQEAGLGEGDIRVIRRGKALEHFSRHYGKVYIERGRDEYLSVKDVLVGINQLLDESDENASETPPPSAEPYTQQFLRLFADKRSLERDQLSKLLRGTVVAPSDFTDRGWCTEEKKVVSLADPMKWAQEWKGKPRKGMSRDFDQTYFLIGASYEDSGIRVSDTLNSGSFVPHPAIRDLLDWFARHGYDQDMKDAAARARQIYKRWEANHAKEVATQATLFDLDEE